MESALKAIAAVDRVLAAVRCAPKNANRNKRVHSNQLGACKKNPGNVVRRKPLANAIFALIALHKLLRIH